MWGEFLLVCVGGFSYGVVFFGIAHYIAYRMGVFDDSGESTSAKSPSP